MVRSLWERLETHMNDEQHTEHVFSYNGLGPCVSCGADPETPLEKALKARLAELEKACAELRQAMVPAVSEPVWPHQRIANSMVRKWCAILDKERKCSWCGIPLVYCRCNREDRGL